MLTLKKTNAWDRDDEAHRLTLNRQVLSNKPRSEQPLVPFYPVEGKGVAATALGEKVVGTHGLDVPKGGYAADAWGRPIRLPYIFDRVFPATSIVNKGWTPQVYTSGYRFNEMGPRGLLADLSKAQAVASLAKQAAAMGLPSSDEPLVGSPGTMRLVPSQGDAYLIPYYKSGRAPMQEVENYKKQNPDAWWLFSNAGELAPDDRTIVPRGTAQRQAEARGYGRYMDEHNNIVLIQDGKRYLESNAPEPYDIDIPSDRNRDEYIRDYQSKWEAQQPYAPRSEAYQAALKELRHAEIENKQTRRDFQPVFLPTPQVTPGAFSDQLPKEPKRTLPFAQYARDIGETGRDIDKYQQWLPKDTDFDPWLDRFKRNNRWGE